VARSFIRAGVPVVRRSSIRVGIRPALGPVVAAPDRVMAAVTRAAGLRMAAATVRTTDARNR